MYRDIIEKRGVRILKQNKTVTFLAIILPIIIVIGMTAIFVQNYLYNNMLRTCELSDFIPQNGVYDLGDVSIEIVTRGGDSGSWLKDPTYDEDGNEILGSYVGTIYEIVVTNKSPDTISDWEMTVYMPEDLLINNSWNGELEYHQYTAEDERVQFIDLADYSKYDITLDYFMDSVGPMVYMKKGDYFIYHPDTDMNEMPIAAADPDSVNPASVRIGFITYIEDKPIDYVADFSHGEFRFHLRTSVFRSPFFWIFLGLFLCWLVCFLATIIYKVNIRRLVEQNKRDEQIIEQTMRTFVNFIEAKDPNTKGHSLRVAQYSAMLAERLGFSEEECRHIYYIALMHDCGKLYIPDGILTKPAKLTDEEYGIMKKHTEYGSEMLKDFSSIEDIQLGAMYHHERYDGKGYPTGLSGEDIPLVARIICVSDSFDAMNSQRCYRKNLTPDVILSELKNNKGTQFDPVIADYMLKLIDEGKIDFLDVKDNK